MKTKILHIIPGLKIGGTEKSLLKFIINSNNQFNHIVFSLTTDGKMDEIFHHNNVKLVKFNLKNKFIPEIINMKNEIKKVDPNIVYTWLYPANIIGGIVCKFLGYKKIVWGLRGTSIPQSYFSIQGFFVLISIFFSYFIPQKIICNALSVKNFHSSILFDKKKIEVIFNGFDKIKTNKISFEDKKILLNKQINKNTIIIGTIGRYDALKGYEMLISSISTLKKKYKHIKLVMVGRGLNYDNIKIYKLLMDLSLLDDVLLLGEQKNPNKFMEIFDIFCLSSLKEGFPNVLCEAMIHGKLCVSTDVGDVSNILAETGIVVKNNQKNFSEGIEKIINMNDNDKKQMSLSAKNRVEMLYSTKKNTNHLTNLLNDLK